MPDRVVRADILTSDFVNALSWPAEVFYRRLMSIADDYGRCEARPSILRASLFPLKLDRVSEPDVVKWMGECSEAGLVRCYTVDNKEYLEILKFGQRLRAMKSRYPAPDKSDHPPSSADNCGHMTADDSNLPTYDGLKRNESESETESENEKKNTPNGVGGAGAPPPDPIQVYKQLEKNKDSIWSYIKAYRPFFVEPYVDLWNLFAQEKGLAQVTKISDPRKRKFKVRVKEKAFNFLAVLKKAGQSEFLLTNKWFGFDWILENESNYLKVIEGNYDKPPDAVKPAKSGPAAPQTFGETITYLYGRFQEGQLDQRLITPDLFDYLVVRNTIPVDAYAKMPGDTVEERKAQAIIELFKQKSNGGQQAV